MPKRTPLPCTPANCGELFPKCGRVSTYTNRRCRCDSCYEAVAEERRRHYAKNREAVAERGKQYRAENREAVLEKKRRYHHVNREACIERSKRRYNANREAATEYSRSYQAKNREAVREYKRRYVIKNSEAVAERLRQWRLDNPDRDRENGIRATHRRRARKNAVQTVPFTQEQLEQRFAYYGWRCYLRLESCTGGAEHVEHVKPISKGGAHMLANLRPACGPCNSRKGTKWPFEAAS